MGRQRMGHKPVEQFIEFREAGSTPSGLTKIWHVINTTRPDDEYIGYVSWSGAWRKYVYHSPNDSYYDWECLRLIANFIEEKTAEHKAAKSKA